MDKRLKDFVDGKIAVSFDNKAEYDYFMRLCEKEGLLWGSGLKPTEKDILIPEQYLSYWPNYGVCWGFLRKSFIVYNHIKFKDHFKVKTVKAKIKPIKQKKYEVGDIVLIKEWDDMAKEYGVNGNGDIKADSIFLSDMRELCGEKGTVIQTDISGRYILEGVKTLDWCWWFSNDMIAGKVGEDKTMKR